MKTCKDCDFSCSDSDIANHFPSAGSGYYRKQCKACYAKAKTGDYHRTKPTIRRGANSRTLLEHFTEYDLNSVKRYITKLKKLYSLDVVTALNACSGHKEYVDYIKGLIARYNTVTNADIPDIVVQFSGTLAPPDRCRGELVAFYNAIQTYYPLFTNKLNAHDLWIQYLNSWTPVQSHYKAAQELLFEYGLVDSIPMIDYRETHSDGNSIPLIKITNYVLNQLR